VSYLLDYLPAGFSSKVRGESAWGERARGRIIEGAGMSQPNEPRGKTSKGLKSHNLT